MSPNQAEIFGAAAILSGLRGASAAPRICRYVLVTLAPQLGGAGWGAKSPVGCRCGGEEVATKATISFSFDQHLAQNPLRPQALFVFVPARDSWPHLGPVSPDLESIPSDLARC
jgi:hypothetical protein